jgi:hypothetical protein
VFYIVLGFNVDDDLVILSHDECASDFHNNSLGTSTSSPNLLAT